MTKKRIALLFERRYERSDGTSSTTTALVREATFDLDVEIYPSGKRIERISQDDMPRWKALQESAQASGYALVSWCEWVPTGNESGEILGSEASIRLERNLQRSHERERYGPDSEPVYVE